MNLIPKNTNSNRILKRLSPVYYKFKDFSTFRVKGVDLFCSPGEINVNVR